MPKAGPPSGQLPKLVVITGLSGSGKGTVLRCFEDLGYYSVDNLPVDLIPTFAELTKQAAHISCAALVVDVREGAALARFPKIYRALAKKIPATLLFLEADDAAIVRRFSETRRPHPLGRGDSVAVSISAERRRLASIRSLADMTLNTTTMTAHELRRLIEETFAGGRESTPIAISVVSFGYRNGLPPDADLIFDVRFLPNPNYVPTLRKKSGRHPEVIRFARGYPQTTEFISRVTDLLNYLIPHYIEEGKSYLTIAFGCTGGHHRSVMIADEVRARLAKAGHNVRSSHRDIRKAY